MLTSDLIAVRVRLDADVEVLHTELYDDVATRIRGDSRPWVPLPAGSPRSPFAVKEAGESVVFFSAVEVSSGELAGEALLYGTDAHNRSAHAGLALRPAFRGRGLAVPVLELLCRYGFGIRGLHRLQLETLSDNEPMIRAAKRAGFVEEGRLRDARWVDGGFVDELVFGRTSGPERDQ